LAKNRESRGSKENRESRVYRFPPIPPPTRLFPVHTVDIKNLKIIFEKGNIPERVKEFPIDIWECSPRQF